MSKIELEALFYISNDNVTLIESFYKLNSFFYINDDDD